MSDNIRQVAPDDLYKLLPYTVRGNDKSQAIASYMLALANQHNFVAGKLDGLTELQDPTLSGQWVQPSNESPELWSELQKAMANRTDQTPYALQLAAQLPETLALWRFEQKVLGLLGGAVGNQTYSRCLASMNRQMIQTSIWRNQIKGTPASIYVLGRVLGFIDVKVSELWSRFCLTNPVTPSDPSNDGDFAYTPDQYPYWPQGKSYDGVITTVSSRYNGNTSVPASESNEVNQFPAASPSYDPWSVDDGGTKTVVFSNLSGNPTSARYYVNVINVANPFGTFSVPQLPSSPHTTTPQLKVGSYQLSGGSDTEPSSVTILDQNLQPVVFSASNIGSWGDNISVVVSSDGINTRSIVISGPESLIKFKSSFFDLVTGIDVLQFAALYSPIPVSVIQDASNSDSAIPRTPPNYPATSSGVAPITSVPAPSGVTIGSQYNWQVNSAIYFEIIATFIAMVESVRPITRTIRKEKFGWLLQDAVNYAPRSVALDVVAGITTPWSEGDPVLVDESSMATDFGKVVESVPLALSGYMSDEAYSTETPDDLYFQTRPEDDFTVTPMLSDKDGAHIPDGWSNHVNDWDYDADGNFIGSDVRDRFVGADPWLMEPPVTLPITSPGLTVPSGLTYGYPVEVMNYFGEIVWRSRTSNLLTRTGYTYDSADYNSCPTQFDVQIGQYDGVIEGDPSFISGDNGPTGVEPPNAEPTNEVWPWTASATTSVQFPEQVTSSGGWSISYQSSFIVPVGVSAHLVNVANSLIVRANIVGVSSGTATIDVPAPTGTYTAYQECLPTQLWKVGSVSFTVIAAGGNVVAMTKVVDLDGMVFGTPVTILDGNSYTFTTTSINWDFSSSVSMLVNTGSAHATVQMNRLPNDVPLFPDYDNPDSACLWGGGNRDAVEATIIGSGQHFWQYAEGGLLSTAPFTPVWSRAPHTTEYPLHVNVGNDVMGGTNGFTTISEVGRAQEWRGGQWSAITSPTYTDRSSLGIPNILEYGGSYARLTTQAGNGITTNSGHPLLAFV